MKKTARSDDSALRVRPIFETFHWEKNRDAHFLSTDLRRRLGRSAKISDSLDLLLTPESDQPVRFAVSESWRQQIVLPPCQLIWVGRVLAPSGSSRTLCVEVLIERIAESGATAFETVALPISVLSLLSVARILKEPRATVSDGCPYAGPSEPAFFPTHEWHVDFWVDRYEMAIVTADEIPALRLPSLREYPSFAQSPFCVLADRPAARLLIIPCWEIFRFYYAQSRMVARFTFAFPRWKPETLDELLRYFDGHAFGPRPCRDERGLSIVEGYAAQRLEAIGRDAAVSYARTGHAHIRSIPPFRDGALMQCIGQSVRLGPYDVLFVQEIIASQADVGECGVIRWTRHRSLRSASRFIRSQQERQCFERREAGTF
jgi:hypothetical protein